MCMYWIELGMGRSCVGLQTGAGSSAATAGTVSGNGSRR